MPKVRLQSKCTGQTVKSPYGLQSSYAKVRMGIKYVRQKYVCKNTYANVRLQKYFFFQKKNYVRCKVRMSKVRNSDKNDVIQNISLVSTMQPIEKLTQPNLT